MAEQLLSGIPNAMSNDGIGEGIGSQAMTTGARTNKTLPKSEVQEEHSLTQTNETFPKLGEQDEQHLSQTYEAFLKSEEWDEELLPGILNDITLKHITTKLSWKAFYILSLVSPGWQRAIQNRRVYDERVRTHSTETLLVHRHHCRVPRVPNEMIALFSMRDKCCYELPPIPQLNGGIPRSWKYVSMDGKIYGLEGWDEFRSGIHGNKLYVLDLVGQRHWKQCASMQEQRHRFGCGAIHGKIYVFGGVPGSEVYDPEVDAWSPITPMPRIRFHPDVEILGDELFVYGGTCYYPASANDIGGNHARRFADVYDPVKQEWRLIDPFVRELHERVFSAQGQFYSISEQGINVFDPANKSWKDLHANNFLIDYEGILLCPAVAVNDELLVRVLWYKSTIEHGLDGGGYFFQSKGFGGQSRQVDWQILSKCSFYSGDPMFSVEL